MTSTGTTTAGTQEALRESRGCSRTACPRAAVATLTYNYSDSTVVLGPLAARNEPHSYDLCNAHAGRLTAPRGWTMLRVPLPTTSGAAPVNPSPPMFDQHVDDVFALANAVRE